MNKYVFSKLKDPYNEYDSSNVTFEVETPSLTDILEEFTLFLKACGFTYVESLLYESETKYEKKNKRIKRVNNDKADNKKHTR